MEVKTATVDDTLPNQHVNIKKIKIII